MTIKKSTQRAADLTRQLLSFSRRQAVQVASTDINQLTSEMEALITRSVTPEVEVEIHPATDLWHTDIDRGDFEDALLNLILNARDAMPSGGRLILETHNCTINALQNPGVKPGEYVQLVVRDNGQGIPPEQQEHIFEPFFSTKEQGKGTGLGLAMVFGFVERSGGHVEVQSRSGIGTTFQLYLPRSPGQEQPAQAPSEQPENLPGGRETILVVDDEHDLLELAQESLQTQGYRVLIADDGRGALELLSEEPVIDMLFSDLVMPGGIDGYELAAQATAEHPKLKVLLTSGYTEKVATSDDQARSAISLLKKPYTQAELARRVRLLLGDSGVVTG